MVDENVSDLFLSILLDLLIKLNIFNMHIGQENSVFKKIYRLLVVQRLRPVIPVQRARVQSSSPGN